MARSSGKIPAVRGTTKAPVLPFFIFIIAAILSITLSLTLYTPSAEAQEQYLLMQPISQALTTGSFTSFRGVCQTRISVKFEPPFELSGYVNRDKFVGDFSARLAEYETLVMEWASKQIDGSFAVQSLNMSLKNKRSDKTVYYKFIMFMIKIDQKWKIYHLRGLNF